MHEQGCCCDEAANHQLPTAAAVFIVLHLSQPTKNTEVLQMGERPEEVPSTTLFLVLKTVFQVRDKHVWWK